MKHNTHFILILSLVLVIILGGAGLSLASANPAAAQSPEPGQAGLVVLIIPSEGAASVAEAGPTPVFNVGDTFTVAVVALGVEDPGLFGAQFEVSYQPEFLNAVEGRLAAGSDLLPVVDPVKEVDNTSGLVKFAASRQGDLENLLAQGPWTV